MARNIISKEQAQGTLDEGTLDEGTLDEGTPSTQKDDHYYSAKGIVMVIL